MIEVQNEDTTIAIVKEKVGQHKNKVQQRLTKKVRKIIMIGFFEEQMREVVEILVTIFLFSLHFGAMAEDGRLQMLYLYSLSRKADRFTLLLQDCQAKADDGESL